MGMSVAVAMRRRFGLGVAATFVALAAAHSPAAAQTVSQQIDAAHSGVVPGQAIGPPLKERWRRVLDSSIPVSSTVGNTLAADGRVFVTVQPSGLDARDRLWQRPRVRVHRLDALRARRRHRWGGLEPLGLARPRSPVGGDGHGGRPAIPHTSAWPDTAPPSTRWTSRTGPSGGRRTSTRCGGSRSEGIGCS